jgi:RimJ/RimL family protein N-acetyltransferase
MTDIPALPCPPIDAGVLPGRTVDLERLDVVRHGSDLWRAIGHDAELWTWIPSGPFADETEFRTWLIDRGARETQALYAVIDKTGPERTPAGLYMALSINEDQGTTEVGLNLGPALARQVGGTEAFLLLVEDIMSKGYRRVEWRCTPENAASSRAARRFGFTLEGVLRQTHWLKGGNWDTEVHAILDRDWPAIAARLKGWLAAENFDDEGVQRKPLSAFCANNSCHPGRSEAKSRDPVFLWWPLGPGSPSAPG